MDEHTPPLPARHQVTATVGGAREPIAAREPPADTSGPLRRRPSGSTGIGMNKRRQGGALT